MDPRRKILSATEADEWVAQTRATGLRLGFTCGAFDLLHAGHVQYLAEARALCDRLIVAVNTDESIRRYKSPLRPVNPENQRMFVVAGLASVDAVTPMDEDRPLALLERWKPELYVKGGDYAAESLRSAEAVRSWGGEVRVITPAFSSSSTAMLERAALLNLHAAPGPAPQQSSRGLVLLDRDGTLIRNIPFLHDPSQVELLPGVVENLHQLQEAGFTLAIVSNQQGIGLGYFGAQDFIAVNQRMLRELGSHGIRIAKIYFCPHSLADQCHCRKPAPGMIVRAMQDFDSPPERTFLVGDQDADLAAARNAGCHAISAGESFAAAILGTPA
jgi:rfaE bifunctional protein nucleotidyltransferase chain/domain